MGLESQKSVGDCVGVVSLFVKMCEVMKVAVVMSCDIELDVDLFMNNVCDSGSVRITEHSMLVSR